MPERNLELPDQLRDKLTTRFILYRMIEEKEEVTEETVVNKTQNTSPTLGLEFAQLANHSRRFFNYFSSLNQYFFSYISYLKGFS